MSETNLKLIYDTVNEAYPQYSSEFGDYEKFKNKMQKGDNREQIRKLLINKYGEGNIGDSAFFSQKVEIPLDTEQTQYNNIVETPAEDLMEKELEAVSDNKNGIIEEVSQEEKDYDDSTYTKIIKASKAIELPDDLIKSGDIGKEFRIDDFSDKLESVRVDAEEKLKKHYKTDDVKVTITSGHRDFDLQKELLESGASQTSISLHNFGAAGDFAIEIDGKKMTGDGRGEAGSLEPYQILGDSAKAHDLFWGWKHDSGHVADTRFVDEFLTKNPKAAENEEIKAWYESMNNLDSVDAIYKPALEKLDGIYGNKVERNYVGKGRTIDDLLDTISVSPDTDKEIKKEVVDRSILDKISPTEEVAESVGVADIPGAAPDPFLEVLKTFRGDYSTSSPSIEIQERIGESIFSIQTGMTAWVASGYLGLLDIAATELGFKDSADRTKLIEDFQQKFTYQPRTEAGNIGVRVATVPFELYMEGVEWLGDKVYKKTGSPLLGSLTQGTLGVAPFLISPLRAKYNTYKQNKIKGKSLTIHKWGDKKFYSEYYQDIMINDIVIRGLSTEKFMKKWGIPDNMKNVVENSRKVLERDFVEEIKYEVVKEEPTTTKGKPTEEVKGIDLSKEEAHKKSINPDNVKEVTIEEVGENHVVQVIDKNNKVIDAEVYPTLQEAQIALSSFAEISLIDKGIIAKPPVVSMKLPITKPIESLEISPEDKKKLVDTTAVDESGAPLQVYHGTLNRFNEFEKTKDIGFHLGSLRQAENRIIKDDGEFPEGANIRAHYIDIKNPLRLEDLDNWYPDEIAEALKAEGFTDVPAVGIISIPEDYNILREYVKSKGYDGIIYRNRFEAYDVRTSLSLKDREAYGDTYLDFKDKKALTPKQRTDFLLDLEKKGDYEKGDLVDWSYIVFDKNQIVNPLTPEKAPVSKPKVTGEVKAETLPDKLLKLDKMVSDLDKKEFNKTITPEERIKLGQIRRVQSNIRGKIKKDKDEILSAEKDITESARSFKGKLNIADSKITTLEGKKNRTSKENSDLKLYKNEKAKILRDEKVYQTEVKKDTILRLNKTISDTQKQIVFAKKNPFGRTKRDISNLDKRLKIAKKLKKQLEDEGLSVSHEVYGQLYSSIIPPPIIHLFKLLENKYKAGKKKPFTDADLEQIDYIISKGGTSIPKHELDFLNDAYMLQDKAHRIFLEKIRKRKLEISKSNQVASEWTKTVPNELDRFDIGASIEGIGNIMIEGDTIVDVKSRMTPAKEKAKKEYKIAIEKTRNDINELLAEATGAEGEYIQFLENYLPHFYVTTGKGKDFGPAVDIIKNSPNAKKRKLPTLQDALDAGLVPISQDPVVLYNKYVNTNWSMATNKLFLDKLSKIRDIDGTAMIVPDNNKAPSNYVRFDHPLANRIFGKKDENGIVQPTSFGVRVHPDIDPVVRMLKKHQYDMSPEGLTNVGKAYDKVNAIQKTFQLSVSLFHHVALTESAQAVLAGKNPIRGIFLFGEKNLITNKRGWFPHREGLKLINDEAFYEEMIMSGLQIEHPNLDNHTGTWINLRDGMKDWSDSPIWKNSIQAAYYPIIGFQKGLWNHYHSGLKAFAYNDVVNKSLDLYPELSSTEVKELTASLINDAFGGQEWESRLFLGNPKVQTWLRKILLAPDWTTASASMAAKPAAELLNMITGMENIGRDPRFKDPKFRKMKGKFYSNYWRNIIFSVLGAQQLLQLAIYEKYGDEEKGDKPYMWENETGEQWNADITPLYRAFANKEGEEWTTDQRYYTSMGKQYKEIAGYFDGFAGPINTFKRKSSPMVGYVYELISGSSTSDYPSKWRDEGLTGWISGFSERFVPFSLKGNSFAWALPVHKGMTRYEGRELMDKVIESYIDPSIYQRAINKYGSDKLEPIFGKKFENFEPELEKFVPEVFDALERNGFKPMEVLTNTISRASKKLLNEFISAAMDESGNWKNPDDMSEKDKFLVDYTAYKLAKLNKVSDSLYRSIQARTKTGTVSREGKNFQKVLDIWNEAFKDFDDWDTIEDAWASDAIKNGYFTKYQKDIINLDRFTRHIGMGSGKK